MTTVYTRVGHPDQAPTDWWAEAAMQALSWIDARGLAVRDVLVLVSSSPDLRSARRAFASMPGDARWHPRIETPTSWSASKAPPARRVAGAWTGDPGSDHAQARLLVEGQRWMRGWAERDAAAPAIAAQRLQAAAGYWAGVLSITPPGRRMALIEAARQRLRLHDGPDGIEAALQRMALEWAALQPAYDTDRLFGVAPAGLVVMQPLVDDPLLQALIEAGPAIAAPTLAMCAIEPDADAFSATPAQAPVFLLADDAEGEARAAVAAVIVELSAGHVPVGLVAEDRLLVRRICALLARQGLRVADQTGWNLATTRAAAWLMSAVDASAPLAGHDAIVNWLQHDLGGSQQGGLAALEDHWRRAVAGRHSTPTPEAAELLKVAQRRLRPLAAPATRSLRAWCECLLALVSEGAGFNHWMQDPAGREVLGHLDVDAPGRDGWLGLMLDHAGFRAWLAQSLASARWQPTPPDHPHVVVTPLRQAVMQPFAATVLPGADHVRLRPTGPAPPGQPGDALREALGLPGCHVRARLEAQAFVMLLRAPRLTLIRRSADGDEPMSSSPWVLQWQAERRRRSWSVPPLLPAPLAMEERPARLTSPPLPRAGGPLPPTLSVSALAALRECPYKFYARVRLGLAAWPELKVAAGARDHGDWLHALLQRWHDGRGVPAPIDVEVEAMLVLARETAQGSGTTEDDLWPQQALMDEFARRYVAWQHQRDASGWRYVAGEQPRRIPLGDLEGVELRGTLDRIDEHREAGRQRQRQLLDYKSGRLDRYRQLASQPLEDTQLALYGALEAGVGVGVEGKDLPLSAGYVVLGDPDGIALAEHAEVMVSSAVTLRELAAELRRVMAGEAMPALGGAQECRLCDYGGLCRREEWSTDAVDAVDGDAAT